MPGHKNFDALREKLRSTPEGRAALSRHRSLARLTLALAELPDGSEVTTSRSEDGEGPHPSL